VHDGMVAEQGGDLGVERTARITFSYAPGSAEVPPPATTESRMGGPGSGSGRAEVNRSRVSSHDSGVGAAGSGRAGPSELE